MIVNNLNAPLSVFRNKTNEISGHPAFWASFITVGDPSPLHLGWSWATWGLILGLILAPFAISLLWLNYKRRRNEAEAKAHETQANELAQQRAEKEAADQQIQATNELIINAIKQKIRRNISD